MAVSQGVRTDLENLRIMDEEDEPLLAEGGDFSGNSDYDFCLVGRVLIDSVVNFTALKNTLADLWHPLMGVTIKEEANKRILFRFFSEVDLNKVLEGMPWFFNRHLVVLHRLIRGKTRLW
ncbi:hypothetical protein J1N35_009717 [Gossypium stocksii]|uniref:DUF4283 domain-containing protein n=1 Tax=Gossypium stocksii TaxID=47602 RepID=A0A9D3VYT8_9ROSI|nr:hypothetical protein J1N35_009717 [Gossypium stocksii]